MSSLQTSDSNLSLVMSCSNDALLESYFDSRRLSLKLKQSYTNTLISYGRSVDTPLTEASKETIFSWYKHISGEGKAASTILGYANQLSILYRYHIEFDLGLDDEEAKIMAKRIFKLIPFKDLQAEEKNSVELRDMLILPTEFEAIMQATKHIRPKCLWTLLYDSGCRKGEIVGEKGLKIRDITFGKDYHECRVNGKTGERTVPLVMSVPYLRAWLQIHPDRNNPDAPLFCTVIKGKIKPLTTGSINSLLSRICKVAGIRHIHPHMFRHTRLTDLARQGIGEYLLKKFAGWTPDSKMAARYIALSGRDHMSAVLEADGVQVEKIREDRPRTLMEMSNCPNCDGSIGRDMPFCPYCGYILDDVIGVGRTQGSQVVEETKLEGMRGHSRIEALEQELKDTKDKLSEISDMSIQNMENQSHIEKMNQNYRKVLAALETIGIELPI